MKTGSEISSDLAALMESLTRVTGLYVCVHDRLQLSGLPLKWQEHWNPSCLESKHEHQNKCARFCGEELHRQLDGTPHGGVYSCPFGRTQIAVPVEVDGHMLGVLFSGGLEDPHDEAWLRDRQRVLLAAAHAVGEQMLRTDDPEQRLSRRLVVLAYLRRNLEHPIRLSDLADVLHLSPSRTGHVIRKLFGMTFPQLLASVRLPEGARLLSRTDSTVVEIAYKLGYADQSHFTKAFTAHYRMSPTAYRRQHAGGV